MSLHRLFQGGFRLRGKAVQAVDIELADGLCEARAQRHRCGACQQRPHRFEPAHGLVAKAGPLPQQGTVVEQRERALGLVLQRMAQRDAQVVQVGAQLGKPDQRGCVVPQQCGPSQCRAHPVHVAGLRRQGGAGGVELLQREAADAVEEAQARRARIGGRGHQQRLLQQHAQAVRDLHR